MDREEQVLFYLFNVQQGNNMEEYRKCIVVDKGNDYLGFFKFC